MFFPRMQCGTYDEVAFFEEADMRLNVDYGTKYMLLNIGSYNYLSVMSFMSSISLAAFLLLLHFGVVGWDLG